MQEFTKSLWFIIAFLFSTALLRSFAGEKFAVIFLLLVLIGMILTNAGKFANLLNKVQGV